MSIVEKVICDTRSLLMVYLNYILF